MSVYRRSKLAINSFINLTSNRTHQFSSFNSTKTSHFTISPKPNFFQIRRHYCVDRNQVRHFKPRGPPTWYQDRRKVLIVVVVGSGLGISVYFGNLETIPYTKRNHLVLLSVEMEKRLGGNTFRKIKQSFKGKILPDLDPTTVRIRMIAGDIIEPLQRGVSKEKVARLNLEVLVVDSPEINAVCYPGGKIVVFTGLLKHLTTDDEIATVIAHEVAHAVARHTAEEITHSMWLPIIQIILLQVVAMPKVLDAMSDLLLNRPFSRRMEIEADYIGVLLMASAGYDPRIAPLVYLKLGKVFGDKPLQDYHSTHPSWKKRAQLLAQARVMEEALTVYKEVRAGSLVQD